mgnify:CR=1 FL=1
MTMKPRYPGWRYGPNGEAEIFQCAEDVPEGWYDTPQEAEGKKAKMQKGENAELKPFVENAAENGGNPPKIQVKKQVKKQVENSPNIPAMRSRPKK